MKTLTSEYFFEWLANKKEHFPLSGQIELTYRCNLNCVHCYCKGSEYIGMELDTKEWKYILDEIQQEGCIYLTITGGEPLIREDFLELYAYAKEKGFIITLFTDGQLFTDELINYMKKSPLFAIEITLNGITAQTYESITQVKCSFEKIIKNIKKLKTADLPLILKSNCLKENKHEIAKIKGFVDGLLGKKPGKFYYKYDPMIYPRLNGDKIPTLHRLDFNELEQLRKDDPDIWKEYERGLHADMPDLGRDKDFLYRCNTWMSQFFINPFGRLKFCEFTEKYSIDLKDVSFREGFYSFPKILNERFKIGSKCIDCHLRPICYHCPARAFMENGDEERPVEYYCKLAEETREAMALAVKT